VGKLLDQPHGRDHNRLAVELIADITLGCPFFGIRALRQAPRARCTKVKSASPLKL
jgi:hypothetical protein